MFYPMGYLKIPLQDFPHGIPVDQAVLPRGFPFFFHIKTIFNLNMFALLDNLELWIYHIVVSYGTFYSETPF